MRKFLSNFFWLLSAIFLGIALSQGFIYGVPSLSRKLESDFFNMASRASAVAYKIAPALVSRILFILPFDSDNGQNLSINLKGDVVSNVLNIRKADEKEKVVIYIAGELMLGRGVRAAVYRETGGNYSSLFERVGFLKSGDIVFGNLTGAFPDSREDVKNQSPIKIEPRALLSLAEAGFNVLLVDDNRGALLDKEEIFRAAGNENNSESDSAADDLVAPSENVKAVEKSGNKFCFATISVKSANIAINRQPRFSASPSPAVLEKSDKEFLSRESSKCDLTVAILKMESSSKPLSVSNGQSLMRSAVNAGAGIVIGSGISLNQKVEQYKNGLIAYNLGSFISDQRGKGDADEGIVLKLTAEGTSDLNIEQMRINLDQNFRPVPEI